MVTSLRHRGPDDTGVWVDPKISLAIGHTRLSILEPSSLGSQPMTSQDGRFVMSFNGEIYNYREISKALGNYFDPKDLRSDSRVLVESFSQWGIDRTLNKVNGMFALALWDRTHQTLYLIRDRVGIKPLYWCYTGSGTLLFGSELKALRVCNQWTPEVNQEAIGHFLKTRKIPSPLTIYRNVHKLQPGHILVWRPGDEPATSHYWSLPAFQKSDERGLSISDNDAIDQLDDLLINAVGDQMVSDVPLGAFLSGGLDSTLVTAIMQSLSTSPIKTFSIGFSDRTFDESSHATEVASYLGTDHEQVCLNSKALVDEIPAICTIFDEPFSDSSQIPTLALCRLARQDVTVALSGDGGDEVFGGYERYRWASSLDCLLKIPPTLRSWCRPPATSSTLLNSRLLKSLIKKLGVSHPEIKLEKLLRIIPCSSRQELYDQLTSVSGFDSGITEPIIGENVLGQSLLVGDGSFLDLAQYQDALFYLPDDVLTKVDRASMAVSLEVRVPLLDHRLFDYVWSLPFNMRIRNRKTKWLLREVLRRYVPDNLVDRPKTGFSIPLSDWLAGPLSAWVGDTLHTKSGMYEYVDRKRVQDLFHRHNAGEHNLAELLWSLLMLSSWFQLNDPGKDLY